MIPFVRTTALIVLLGPRAALGAANDLGAQSFEVHGPTTQQLAVLDAPAVAGDSYGFTGTVSYEGVAGDAYIEMWSEFPDGSRYFARTLDTRGPMAKLTGTAAARAFSLPFFLTPDAVRPVRLEVNVVLPAAGRVVVRDLHFAAGSDLTRTRGAWWSAETAGWIGGVAGSAVGLLGALIGTLCSLGRGRRFVISGLLALAAFGGALLVVGMVALASGQPYQVWYPLLLLGVLDPVLALSLLPTARRRFEGPPRAELEALARSGRRPD